MYIITRCHGTILRIHSEMKDSVERVKKQMQSVAHCRSSYLDKPFTVKFMFMNTKLWWASVACDLTIRKPSASHPSSTTLHVTNNAWCYITTYSFPDTQVPRYDHVTGHESLWRVSCNTSLLCEDALRRCHTNRGTFTCCHWRLALTFFFL
jgi:hypothetical protein